MTAVVHAGCFLERLLYVASTQNLGNSSSSALPKSFDQQIELAAIRDISRRMRDPSPKSSVAC